MDLWTASERSLAVESWRGEIKKTADLIRNAKTQEELVRGTVGVAISKFKYMEYLDNHNRLQNELTILDIRLKSETEELSIAQGKIKALKESRTETLLKERESVRSNLQDTMTELVKTRRNSTLQRINAPETGFLTELKLTHVHQMVKTSEEIAKIVPSDAALVIRAKANSNDIGFIAIGAPVQAKIDAFPYQMYGSIEGKITWISADSEEEHSTTNGLNNRQYTLEAELGEWKLSRALRERVKPGMSVLMDIKTDRRSIASIIFTPITSNIDTALRKN